MMKANFIPFTSAHILLLLLLLLSSTTGTTILTISVASTASSTIESKCSVVNDYSNCSLTTAWNACVNFISVGDQNLPLDSYCEIILPQFSNIDYSLSNGPLTIVDSSYLNGSIAIIGNGATITLIENSQNVYHTDTRFIVWDAFSSYSSDSEYFTGLIISNLTITGFGQLLSTVGGGAIYTSHISYITLSHVTMTHNKGHYGGALYVDTPMVVSIDNCIFDSNEADQSGGAIYLTGNTDDDLTLYHIYNTEFLNNFVTNHSGGSIAISDVSNIVLDTIMFTNGSASITGGAIAVSESKNIQVHNIHIYHSSTNITSLSTGGAISFYSSSNVLLSNITISNSSATSYGGGVYMVDCSNVLMDDVFVQYSSAKIGGGICIFTSTNLTLRNIIVFDSHAVRLGGGLDIEHCTNVALMDVMISRTQAIGMKGGTGGGISFRFNENTILLYLNISNTYAQYFGGGIHAFKCNNLSIAYANFENVGLLTHYKGFSGGGGVCIYSSTNVYLADLKIANAYSFSYGGGIDIEHSSNAVVLNCEVTNTTAYYGAGLSTFYASNITVMNFRLIDCWTLGTGGAMQLWYTDTIILKSVFVTQTQHAVQWTSMNGGGIGIQQSSSIVLIDVYASNLSAVMRGGGLYVMQSSDISLTNINIRDCFAKYGGGIAIMDSTSVVVSAVNVTGSKGSYIQNGGCVHLEGISNARINNVLVSDGFAATGGGISVVNCTYVVLTSFTATACTARDVGGGLAVIASSEIVMLSGIVTNCLSYANGGGIAIYEYNFKVVLANITIASNLAENVGGGLYMEYENNQVILMSMLNYENMQTYTYESDYGDFRTFWFENASYVIVYFHEESVLHTGEFTCCVDVKFSDSSDDVVLSIDAWSEFPGVEASPFIIHGETINIAITNKAIAGSANFLKVHFIPVYDMKVDKSRFVEHGAMRIIENHALSESGGFGVSAFNLGILITNALITDNYAMDGNGGGIMFEVGNGYSMMIGSNISNNRAFESGGAIYFGFTHFDTVLYDVSIASNTAYEKGGGININSDNRNTVGNQLNLGIQIYNSIIEDNYAGFSGGGISIGNENAVDVTNTTINHNQVGTVEAESSSVNGGGALYLERFNALTLTDVNIQENVVNLNHGCGGAIMVNDVRSFINLESSINMDNNSALNGAGICVIYDTTITVSGSLSIKNNKATDAGGAMLLADTEMWFSTDNSSLQINSNTAQRGSALFLHNVLFSKHYADSRVGETIIESNIATKGSTIYWIKSQGLQLITTEMFSRLTLRNNTDSYGKNGLSTQPTRILGPIAHTVNSFATAIDPISVAVLDAYEEVITTPYADWTIYVGIDDDTTDCLLETRPYLAGSNVFGEEVITGVALFSDLKAFCYPNGKLGLTWDLDINPLPSGIPATGTDSYVLSNTTLLYFRQCVDGEYISDNQCAACSNGSYSLEFEDLTTKCQSCGELNGVKQCYGNNLELEPGYWRHDEQSTKVMTCLVATGCVGGVNTGNDLCAEGYRGPLCGACQDGYRMTTSGECVICDSSGFSVGDIVTLTVLFLGCLLLIIFAILWCRYDHKKFIVAESTSDSTAWCGILHKFSVVYNYVQTHYNRLMIRTKIIVATFQVVTSAAEVFDVKMPSVFDKFTRLINFVNFDASSLFPVSCFYHVNFMDTLLWATLGPIACLIFLLICFAFEWHFIALYGDEEISNWATSQLSQKLDFSFRGNDDSQSPVDNTTHESNLSSTKTFERVSSRISLNGLQKRDNRTISANRATIKSRYLQYIFYITYLVLPSVSTTIFKLFVCEEVDSDHHHKSKSVLVADVTISCNSIYYKNWLLYGYAMVLIYPIGITAFYWLCLRYYKNAIRERPTEEDVQAEWANKLMFSERRSKVRKHNHKKVAARIGFLWEAYQPNYWYWEVIESGRRILLTAVLSICATGSSKQNVLGVLISFFFLELLSIFQPYYESKNFWLAQMGQTQIFIVYFAAIVISNNLLGSTWDNLIGWLMILVNLIVIVGAFYFEVEDWLQEQEELQKHASLFTMFWNRKVQPFFNFLFNESDGNSVQSEVPLPLHDSAEVVSPPLSLIEEDDDAVVETMSVQSVVIFQPSDSDNHTNNVDRDAIDVIFDYDDTFQHASNGIDCLHEVPAGSCGVQ